jgi:DNA-binding response OmpR family regulator
VLLRGALERALRTMGFDVISAADAQTAHELLRDAEVDAVLLDLHLPVVGGDAFCLAAVREWPRLRGRVVLMTGDTAADRSHWPDILRECVMLYKPFPLDLLRTIVQDVLDRSVQHAPRAENNR